MGQLYRKWHVLAAVACILAMVGIVVACSLEEPEKRQIRAHTSVKLGVAHAEPSMNAERYCQKCHGVNLAGGSDGAPSCYTCHGKNWNAITPTTSLAPVDHTVDMGGFRHHPDLNTTVSTCESCHGVGLLGTGKDGHPSCYLCHDKVWN